MIWSSVAYYDVINLDRADQDRSSLLHRFGARGHFCVPVRWTRRLHQGNGRWISCLLGSLSSTSLSDELVYLHLGSMYQITSPQRQLRMWVYKEEFHTVLSPADEMILQEHLGKSKPLRSTSVLTQRCRALSQQSSSIHNLRQIFAGQPFQVGGCRWYPIEKASEALWASAPATKMCKLGFHWWVGEEKKSIFGAKASEASENGRTLRLSDVADSLDIFYTAG